ncbi:high choriolytic enzyme 1-like [Scomber japonicus]|uniref:high choriolytic enzyme 1-like n=1 Tax=Scomber japonicus TaxID=13676 RepID=UPI0023056F09|nr:high choriolytic enzyme 1-like [Scomber japonicus]
MILQTAVLSILLCSVQSFTLQASFEKSDESSGNTIEEDDFSVSTLIEKANANLGKNPGDPLVMFGDIAVSTDLGNADPCTARGCKWPKASDGNVYVPYRISKQYSPKDRSTIIQGLESFSRSTCIRFIPFKRQKDFLDIQSDDGCYSKLGRRRGPQILSLDISGCIYHHVIQHELLHALGFHHEQNRSDRDKHVQIVWENILDGEEDQFEKVQTRNLRTPYDYNSIMHYGRNFFSKNGQPTIVPIPDPNVPIGEAKEMSPNDILRVNRLYRCSITASQSDVEPVKRNQFL